MTRPLTVAILTVSDTCSKDESSDKTGPKLNDLFSGDSSMWSVVATSICADVVQDIQRIVKEWTDVKKYNLIVTAGGTGFAVRDVTPEAIKVLLDKEAPGLVHAMFAKSFTITPLAAMARLVAGVRRESIVVTVPGSPKGAVENLEAILKLLPHASDLVTDRVNSRIVHSKGIKSIEEAAGLISPNEPAKVHASTSTGHAHYHHNHHHNHKKTSHMSNDPSASVTRRARSSPYPMTAVVDALDLVLQHTPSPKPTSIPINGFDKNHATTGYFVSEDVFARESVPAYRASIVDGYAVIAEDGKGIWPVVSVSHAKAEEAGVPTLQRGQIARITTGGPLPPGADSVVMVEDTRLVSSTTDGREELTVEILVDAVKDDNVREPGSDLKKDTLVMSKVERISRTGGEIGLLTSAGHTHLPVYEKPVVGVLSTGDELVDASHGGSLLTGQIRDSNRASLLSTLQAHHFPAVDLGIASDSPLSLEETLRTAFQQCAVVITTGGVSMGELDLLKPTLERTFNGTIHFGRVAMKPGKPTTFATIPPISSPSSSSSSTTASSGNETRRETVVFALPGNPASALVTFQLFVLPSLLKLSGHPFNSADEKRRIAPRVKICLGHDIKLDSRPEFHRVTVAVNEEGRIIGTSTGFQRSSRVGSLRCHALLCLPPRTEALTQLHKGELCEAIIVDWPSS